MTGHTPGPWEWVDSREYGYTALWNPETREEVLTPDGFNDGDRPITWMGEELTVEDKALIAAAPDMLKALQGGVRKLETYVSVCPGDKELRELLTSWHDAIATAQ